VHDGPGIRTTVFMKGCPLSCPWCHNPESQSPLPEATRKNIILDGRKFQVTETAGMLLSPDEVLKEILKDKVFYDESAGGVTFSGGEPLMQPGFLEEILVACRHAGTHTAIDTCGYADKKILEKIGTSADLFLYDLKLMDDGEHITHTGVSNKIILENFLFLVEHNFPVQVRFPVIPGITDTDENISRLIAFIEPIKERIVAVNLLPYHATAKGKYVRFGKEYRLKGLKSPERTKIESLKKQFAEIGLNVTG
jgi:pyruvate formate lyase activating enzyme